jgi:hypothetical protein
VLVLVESLFPGARPYLELRKHNTVRIRMD